MPEIQDIFIKYGSEYRKKHKLTLVQHKAMSAIEKCRTSQLGGHMDVCQNCGNVQISYNSCRNRHCPKCQSLAKERWIENQKSNLLNIGYFHVVFTIPDTLNLMVYQNQRELYTLLFKAVAETLSELASNKKYLGAKLGFTSILHTWGQNLMHHPHIHCIVSGGGLSSIGKWINFFIPVKVLSRKFRGKFLYYRKKLYYQNKLEFHGSQKYLSNNTEFEKQLSSLYSKEWIVYCKPPFKNAACVVEYLGRYTHRVAISNNRIVSTENGKITFKWRDYKDNSKWKLIIKPSKNSTKALIRKCATIILKEGKAHRQKDLIRRLNQVIRGWSNYHRHIVASQTFSYVNNTLYLLLQQWAKHRHPNKNKWWRLNKYRHEKNGKNGCSLQMKTVSSI